MEIRLWAVRLDRPLTAEEAAALLELLPPARRERLLRTREAARREPLCAYGALVLALREVCGWPRLPALAYAERGKPWFPAFPAVRFSLSHTEGAVLAGLSDSPLGVDIERTRPVSRRLQERMAPGGTEEDLFRVWVRREARTKRTGAGIGSALREEPPMEAEETYWELEPFPGYIAGVSGTGELGPLTTYPQEEFLRALLA